ncbi:MAG: leucyl aminopeptidase, partial [Gammaproteobacteria bacterium]|nr:leucyl aminopeptidase [Gammaproteobacteria bacterium]
MEIRFDTQVPSQAETDCIIAGVLEEQGLSTSAEQLNQATQGKLEELFKNGDLPLKPGKTLMLHNLPGIKSRRLLLVGCGKVDKLNVTAYRKIITAAIKSLDSTPCQSALCCLAELDVQGAGLYRRVRLLSETIHDAVYRFEQLKSDDEAEPHNLNTVAVAIPADQQTGMDSALQEGNAI